MVSLSGGDKEIAVTFQTDMEMVDEIIEAFGRDIIIGSPGGKPEKAEVTLKYGKASIKKWLLQHIESVELISPAYLREEIKQSLQEGIGKYAS